MVWTKIEPNVWKPEIKDDNISGILVRVEPKREELSARYWFENRDGQWLVWGSTVLDDRMSLVNVGQLVRITYKGKVKNSKRQDVKLFTVEVSNKLDESVAEEHL